ncbi:hypothetical protein EJ03DRAFT_105690 [Teratosphaeria nubilosa]|uniref:Uncharacterized protein n=1 Tax=Teratosphaeria nubilosa TaxID=161662 RepID=A0A6G1LMF6_9PEZI|nr:hypothetical protein EJ03DRAFT_105690 [Teratosphaeria nubilosa]
MHLTTPWVRQKQCSHATTTALCAQRAGSLARPFAARLSHFLLTRWSRSSLLVLILPIGNKERNADRLTWMLTRCVYATMDVCAPETPNQCST